MTRSTLKSIALAALVGLILVPAEMAWAQAGANQVIRQSVRGGQVRGRAPGNLVNSALAAASTQINQRLAGVEIVDTEQLSVGDELLITALETAFEAVNNAIVGFHNLILLRGGRSPVLPTPIFTSGGGGTDSGDTSGGLDLGGLDLGNIGDLLGQFN